MVKTKPKILLTRKLQDFAINKLKKRYQIEIHSGRFPMPTKILLKKIKDKEGLICMPYDIIDKQVLDAATKLRAISTYSVGYDHIDIKYALQKNIKIGYTPDVLTETTADLAFTIMLDILRRVSEGDRLIRKGGWKQVFGADTYVGTEVAGKTVGILGMGRIGKSFAKKAKVFGMKIIYHNRHRLNKLQEKSLDAKYVTLDELFSKSDIVSIHVPYSEDTHELVNANLLNKMKKESYLVNTARGKIVNEQDLIKVLQKKQIAGAALDVFYNEPIGKNNPLTKLENVVLTPHIGSSTEQTRAKMADITVLNLNLAMANKNPKYYVS